MTTARPQGVAVALWALSCAGAAQGPGSESACQRGARLESLGLATGGANGLLELAVEGAPAFGLPFHFAVRNGVPGEQGLAVFGAKESPLFLPDFGATVFPSFPVLLGIPFTIDAHGASPPLLEHMPVDTALCGSAFVVQAAATDASATGGASFTKAVRLRFGTASGDALFGPSDPEYASHSSFFDGQVGDLDGDQHPDVAFVGLTDDGEDEAAIVLFGAGDGTIGSAQVLPTGNPFPESMALATSMATGPAISSRPPAACSRSEASGCS
jgi:hypothetical protein